MKIFKLYKHPKMLDSAMIPTKIEEKGNDIIARVIWVNVTNLKNMFPMGNDTVKIRKDDLNQWKEITHD